MCNAAFMAVDNILASTMGAMSPSQAGIWREAILNASMREEDYIEYRRKLEALATYADSKTSSERKRTLDNLL
jgi:hypothetical protein